jgi:hypothetical protein
VKIFYNGIEKWIIYLPFAGTAFAVIGGYVSAKAAMSCSSDPNSVGMAVGFSFGTIAGTLLFALAIDRFSLIASKNLERSKTVMEIARKNHEDRQAGEMQLLAQDVDTMFLVSDVIFIPTGPNDGNAIHINAKQLKYMQLRIRKGKTNIPYEIYQDEQSHFSRTEIKKFREELLEQGLAITTKSKQIVLTKEACLGFLRAESPTPLKKG